MRKAAMTAAAITALAALAAATLGFFAGRATGHEADHREDEVAAEETKQAAFEAAETDPFCRDDRIERDPVACLLTRCWTLTTTEGEASNEGCGELRKRWLDIQRWELCSAAEDRDDCFEEVRR